MEWAIPNPDAASCSVEGGVGEGESDEGVEEDMPMNLWERRDEGEVGRC